MNLVNWWTHLSFSASGAWLAGTSLVLGYAVWRAKGQRPQQFISQPACPLALAEELVIRNAHTLDTWRMRRRFLIAHPDLARLYPDPCQPMERAYFAKRLRSQHRSAHRWLIKNRCHQRVTDLPDDSLPLFVRKQAD
jgi:hypothetical protein